MTGWLTRLDQWLSARSRSSVLIISLMASVLVSVADNYVDPDLLILYLVPLFLASWYGGKRDGAVVAFYSAGAGYVAQVVLTGSTTFDSAYAGTVLVRLASFLALSAIFARLHEARRQQEELVGFIVHDLRSPLASAITGLQTLEQSSDHLEDIDREMVQLALVSNQRALTLVNSILDVAKLEAGGMQVRHDEVDVRAFIEECFQHVSLWAQGSQIELVAEVHAVRTVLDPDLTSRVLTNLLSNALKFSPPESQVVVRADEDGHGVRFSVIDKGPGIPPEFVDSIFEPFSQVKGTRGGTGLGLTFCRLAVKAQGGRIGVKSKLGHGSTFWFWLPHPHHHAQSPERLGKG